MGITALFSVNLTKYMPLRLQLLKYVISYSCINYFNAGEAAGCGKKLVHVTRGRKFTWWFYCCLRLLLLLQHIALPTVVEQQGFSSNLY